MARRRLDDGDLRTADRMLVWLLVVFGYMTAMAMSLDQAEWNAPVFKVMRKLPGTPYSWAVMLAVAVSVYTVGELSDPGRRWRGRVVIVGAGLCGGWYAALALTMSRMVYEQPDR